MSFPYPPLPAVDGLRILELLPGKFWEPLQGNLIPVPFSKKPQYIALSYMWADPDPRHAEIPAFAPESSPGMEAKHKQNDQTTVESKEEETTKPGEGATEQEVAVKPMDQHPSIKLNGHLLSIGHNAALAMRFIRSDRYVLPLWIDAICICQANVLERNSQVALMAFIYTRATAVVSWLGVPELRDATSQTNQSLHPQALRDEMERTWWTGQGRQIANRFANNEGERTSDLSFTPNAFSLPVTRTTLDPGVERVTNNPYWTRLWVIQEVCLPRNLAFLIGGELWPVTGIAKLAGDYQSVGKQHMERLLGARNSRFSDAMRLEALIERFRESGCAEMRDRVFGLVGLANDVDSFALGIPEATVREEQRARRRSGRSELFRSDSYSEDEYGGGSSLRLTPSGSSSSSRLRKKRREPYASGESDSELSDDGYSSPSRPSTLSLTKSRFPVGRSSTAPRSGLQIPSLSTITRVAVGLTGSAASKEVEREVVGAGSNGQRRGRGMLEIDYTRPYYDIWRDVVSYMHFRAKPLQDFGKEPAEMEDERRARVVRFAGVVQKAFEGKVEEELLSTPRHPLTLHGDGLGGHRTILPGDDFLDLATWPPGFIKAKGYIAGTIVYLGPSYSDFVGSYKDQQRWIGSWDFHYHDARDLEKLRQMEETYAGKILDFSDADLARISAIPSLGTVAWSPLRILPKSGITWGTAHVDMVPDSEPQQQHDGEPVRFLGSDFCMGLAPAGAAVGDLVLRFWNCDAAIVVRAISPPAGRNGAGELQHKDRLYRLVGRADVSEHAERRGEYDQRAKDEMKIRGATVGQLAGAQSTKGMYVRMDFATLQRISAAIAI